MVGCALLEIWPLEKLIGVMFVINKFPKIADIDILGTPIMKEIWKVKKLIGVMIVKNKWVKTAGIGVLGPLVVREN